MTDSTAEQLVLCERDDRGIARITLNRPDKHNAFDDRMIARLRQLFDALRDDNDVRIVILQAAGKSFSAGGDLAWMQRMADYDYGHNMDDARALAEMLQALKTLPQPTIARVQGFAFGGAVGLVSCCDVAIASDDARFGLTEARIGLIPATIGPHVIEAMGTRWARRLFLTAERFDAQRALHINLIHEVCALPELDERVASVAKELLANSPAALREAKLLVQDFAGRPIDEAVIADTSARIAHMRVSEEGQEGLRAFLEKRTPAWAQETTRDV